MSDLSYRLGFYSSRDPAADQQSSFPRPHLYAKAGPPSVLALAAFIAVYTTRQINKAALPLHSYTRHIHLNTNLHISRHTLSTDTYKRPQEPSPSTHIRYSFADHIRLTSQHWKEYDHDNGCTAEIRAHHESRVPSSLTGADLFEPVVIVVVYFTACTKQWSLWCEPAASTFES